LTKKRKRKVDKGSPEGGKGVDGSLYIKSFSNQKKWLPTKSGCQVKQPLLWLKPEVHKGKERSITLGSGVEKSKTPKFFGGEETRYMRFKRNPRPKKKKENQPKVKRKTGLEKGERRHRGFQTPGTKKGEKRKRLEICPIPLATTPLV